MQQANDTSNRKEGGRNSGHNKTRIAWLYREIYMCVDCGSESHAEWILLKSKELTQHCSPLYTKVLVDSRVRHWGHGPGNTAQGSCRKLATIPLLIMMLWETWKERNSSRPNYSIKYFEKATDNMKGKRRQTTKWPLILTHKTFFSCCCVDHLKSQHCFRCVPR